MPPQDLGNRVSNEMLEILEKIRQLPYSLPTTVDVEPNGLAGPSASTASAQIPTSSTSYSAGATELPKASIPISNQSIKEFISINY